MPLYACAHGFLEPMLLDMEALVMHIGNAIYTIFLSLLLILVLGQLLKHCQLYSIAFFFLMLAVKIDKLLSYSVSLDVSISLIR